MLFKEVNTVYKNQDIIISTTSTLEGYKIEAYLGIISVRAVTGTGYFADLAASFSDVFGGPSMAYREQLSRIDDEALALLEEEAKKLGANAVLGVRIDHDEISGKGKQMFMVTVAGTGVITQSLDGDVNECPSVGRHNFALQLQKQRIIEQMATGEWNGEDSESWDFISRERVGEVATDVVRMLMKNQASIDLVRKYFVRIEPTLAQNALYAGLLDAKSRLTRERIADVIMQCHLLDLTQLPRLLLAEDDELFVIGCKLISAEKAAYYPPDIVLFQELADILDNRQNHGSIRYNHLREISKQLVLEKLELLRTMFGQRAPFCS